MAQLVHHVCLEAPLAVVLEDAHWADEASLLLLRHITAGLTDERLLILINSRDLEQRHGELLARLMREPRARQIYLRGLAAPAVREQLEAILDRGVEDADVAQVTAWTGGNPFFVGEVGRAMAAGASGRSRAHITPSLRAAIAMRLERRTPGCVRAVHAAATLGPQFSVTVVAGMLDVPPLAALKLIDEAQRAGFVEAGAAPDQFRFVHALVRDAVEAGLAPVERMRLHRSAAEILERQHANRLEPYVFELARHWVEAGLEGDAPTAVR